MKELALIISAALAGHVSLIMLCEALVPFL